MLTIKHTALYLVLAASIVVSATRVLAADTASTAAVTDQGDGLLTQGVTGLVWTQADNGSDIGWEAAGAYCTGRGNGWRLPSVEELLSLYDKSGTLSSGCGAGYTCGVSPLFRLTGPWYWSNEANNALSSWLVILTKGTPYAYAVSDPAKKRVLCVRAS
ncbi:MAG: DUF1566 domain-containing protein [Halioglobus sp.]